MPNRNRNILIIDDNQTIHEDFRKILGSDNSAAAALDEADSFLFGDSPANARTIQFEIDSAYQGQEGLALVEKNLKEGKQYSMAFVDVRMPPGWDGIETVARIWKVDPEIQVVICTAYSEYSWEDMLVKLGQNDKLLILKKPFDNIEVQQLANALTEKWHLLQETKHQLTLLEKRVKQRTQELLDANKKLEAEVAERKKTEEALRQSQETILRQERLTVVGQLSAGIAHEFNNILTIIQGHSNLILSAGNQNAPTTESLNHIINSTERAASLTRQMLAFGRKQVMRQQSFDLAEIVSRMGNMLERVLYENITLRYDRTNALPCVRADPGMIEQVIMNLVLNARDAMPHGGEITISAKPVEFAEKKPDDTSEKRAGKFICLSISDTGCGMDAEILKHIFEPFFTTKDVGKGTGLGLATAYGIIQQHNGWIEVTSAPEKGTRFQVYLPQGQPATQAQIEPQKTSTQQNGRKILVVEDEAPLRNLVRTILTRHGFQVFEAASGREALDNWEKDAQNIDLLFTDMMMPDGILGRELAERFKKANPNLRVLFTTGYSEDVVRTDKISDNAQFLAKPYTPADLIRSIQSNLESAAV